MRREASHGDSGSQPRLRLSLRKSLRPPSEPLRRVPFAQRAWFWQLRNVRQTGQPGQFTESGLTASVHLLFAFFGVDERNRDVTPIDN